MSDKRKINADQCSTADRNALLCLGQFFGSAGIGGHSVNHMDIGPRHAGMLMGITNSAVTIPGILGVSITGLILQ